METIRKSSRNARNQKHVTEMRNAFDGLLSRLDTVKERIIELEDRAIEITQTETQKEKLRQKQGQQQKPQSV